jgi:hypothetical protein
MGKIIANNEYWIEYGIEDGNIVKTSRKYNEEND